jgi:hypothetical protein
MIMSDLTALLIGYALAAVIGLAVGYFGSRWLM